MRHTDRETTTQTLTRLMLTYPYTDGQAVTYHGSVTDRHGRTYRAWICPCRLAHPVDQPRFMLTDPDTGRAAAWHVRPTSLTPTGT